MVHLGDVLEALHSKQVTSVVKKNVGGWVAIWWPQGLNNIAYPPPLSGTFV